MINGALSQENFCSPSARFFFKSRNCTAQVRQQLSGHGENFENTWSSKNKKISTTRTS